jgi:hypothetical protein
VGEARWFCHTINSPSSTYFQSCRRSTQIPNRRPLEYRPRSPPFKVGFLHHRSDHALTRNRARAIPRSSPFALARERGSGCCSSSWPPANLCEWPCRLLEEECKCSPCAAQPYCRFPLHNTDATGTGTAAHSRLGSERPTYAYPFTQLFRPHSITTTVIKCCCRTYNTNTPAFAGHCERR